MYNLGERIVQGIGLSDRDRAVETSIRLPACSCGTGTVLWPSEFVPSMISTLRHTSEVVAVEPSLTTIALTLTVPDPSGWMVGLANTSASVPVPNRDQLHVSNESKLM